tara:strand:+ start:663 stop:971 length:309 start_codon:yes stop_codon:yes gene_type:complete
MKTSTLLIRAKRYLWDGKEEQKTKQCSGLCVAILLAETHITYPLGRDVRNRIQKSLEGHMYAVGWLEYKARVPRRLLTAANVQEYRHRWLDALIAEYKSRGD